MTRKNICEPCKGLDGPKTLSSCAACRKVKAKDWYARNKDKYRAWRKAYKKANQEKIRALEAGYRQRKLAKDPDYFNRKHRSRTQKRPGHMTPRNKRWRANNRDHYLAGRRLYFSKKTYGKFAQAHRALIEMCKTIGEPNEIRKTNRRSA